MIRPARYQDVEIIETMIRELYDASKYLRRFDINPKAVRQLLMGMVGGQNQKGPQGSFVNIAEQDGKPVGFMAGVFERVYHIGDKLTANDVFLYVRPGAGSVHGLRLIDAYVAWARANPKVLEIMLSWNDTIPGSERIAAVYRRKGFEKVGEMFEMRLDVVAEEAA